MKYLFLLLFTSLAMVEPLTCYFLKADYNKLTVNGGLGEDLSYAAKVNQVLIHGFPYDPHIKENRSLRDWLPDCVTFYLTAGFVLLSQGSLLGAWCYLIPLYMFACWFVLVYLIFRLMLERDHSILATFILLCFSVPIISHFLLDWRHPLGLFSYLWRSVRGEDMPMINQWTCVPKDIITHFILFGLIFVHAVRMFKD